MEQSQPEPRRQTVCDIEGSTREIAQDLWSHTLMTGSQLPRPKGLTLLDFGFVLNRFVNVSRDFPFEIRDYLAYFFSAGAHRYKIL